jgi:UDP-3-O-[3-hydroxymyristoyl] glucosamine N-acyltransferase
MVDTNFYPTSSSYTIAQLFKLAGCSDSVPNDIEQDFIIAGANELNTAKENEISFFTDKKHLEVFKSTSSGVVIVSEKLANETNKNSIIIIAKDPQSIFVKILNILYPAKLVQNFAYQENTKETAPTFEQNVMFGKNAVIGANVQIGKNTVISPNATIGAGVTIGRNCMIGANTSIEYAHLGDNVIIHAGSRIGNEGFGWLDLGKKNTKVPQLGRVIIQDNVEIGANSTIDRGALGDTTIGEGTKIDNLVQVGHNCEIGRNCLIAAMSGISGSTVIKDGVLFGGGAGTAGHLTIGANSIIHGRAAVTKDLPENSKVAGAPAQDIRDFWKELAILRNLVRGKKK